MKKTEENKTEKLTKRQKEIIAAYAEYGLGKSVAKSLGIAYRTYRNHCTEIYQRLGVHNMTQAVVLAFRAGIVE